jgi:hypothetical protein
MKYTILILVFLAGCIGPPVKKLSIGDSSTYEEYHGVSCKRRVENACIEKGVYIEDNEIRNLIEISRLKNKESYPLMAIRMDKYRSKLENAKVINVVFGNYSAPDGPTAGAAEEISFFKFHDNAWEYLDTAVLLICP